MLNCSAPADLEAQVCPVFGVTCVTRIPFPSSSSLSTSSPPKCAVNTNVTLRPNIPDDALVFSLHSYTRRSTRSLCR